MPEQAPLTGSGGSSEPDLEAIAARVAHDFNNFLAVIQGNNAMVLRKLPPDAPAREFAEQVGETCAQALELVNKLYTYAGQGMPVCQPVDLSALVRECVGDLARRAPAGVHVESSCTEGLPAVSAEAAQVRAALEALFGNACESLMGQPGTIRIAAAPLAWKATPAGSLVRGVPLPPGTYPAVTVTDAGCGMAADTLRRAFVPFFSTKIRGLGMGLPVVSGIMKSHGGMVVCSSAPGAGSTFSLVFAPAS